MSQYKIVGIIGGMGPWATCDIYKKIIVNTNAQRDSDHIHIIIDSNTDIPDRTKAILYNGESPVSHLKKSAQRLENAGVDLIILACNTSHYFINEIRQSIEVPILSMLDAAVIAAKRKGIKKAALFATEGTIKSGIYADVFEKNGIILLMPENKQQRIVTDVIYRGIKACNNEIGSLEFQMLVNRFCSEGAETVILACTELPVFIEERNITGNFIDPSFELAKYVIRQAGADLRGRSIESE